MLKRSFIHLPGVGAQTERALWTQGCADWDQLIREFSEYSVGSAERKVVEAALHRSLQALNDREHQYFQRNLRQRDIWRAFGDFRESCLYLDIETDGGPNITMIGVYDGIEYVCLTKGEDLENFRDLISHYSMIVTFAGGMFDLPVLEKQFRGLFLDQIHIDLCPLLRRLGYFGGLKAIEKQFGIERSPETDGLSGYDAVRLWRRYQNLRDTNALETLTAYNREDVVNLEPLAKFAYEKMWELTLSGAKEPGNERSVRRRRR